MEDANSNCIYPNKWVAEQYMKMFKEDFRDLENYEQVAAVINSTEAARNT